MTRKYKLPAPKSMFCIWAFLAQARQSGGQTQSGDDERTFHAKSLKLKEKIVVHSSINYQAKNHPYV
jgi:hypothetical protein